MRILYLAGPGDVAGTYRRWQHAEADERECAGTYSGMFFDTCKKLDADALVIASNETPADVSGDRIRVLHSTIRWGKSRHAILYHIGQVLYGLRIWWWAMRFRATVAVVASGTHWFMLTVLHLCGVRVIPTLHGTLWPNGHRPTNKKVPNLISKLNGWFWKFAADATLCISPECERQIREICPSPKGKVEQARAAYNYSVFAAVPPPPERRVPFQVLFVGRIEENKGVFDLLSIADGLNTPRPGAFQFNLCGSGSAQKELQDQIEERQLGDCVIQHGHCDGNVTRQMYGSSHVVIVPTKSTFCEGLNKVAIEAVLAGRPVVTSRMSNALEILDDAAFEANVDDVLSYQAALKEAYLNQELYDQKVAACIALRNQLSNSTRHWGNVLYRVLVEPSNV